MHACTHMHTHTHAHKHMHVHTHIFTHTHTFTHTHIITHTDTHTHTHMHAHKHMHMHKHTYTYIHTFVHMHTHTFTHTHNYTHRHTHTCTNTLIVMPLDEELRKKHIKDCHACIYVSVFVCVCVCACSRVCVREREREYNSDRVYFLFHLTHVLRKVEETRCTQELGVGAFCSMICAGGPRHPSASWITTWVFAVFDSPLMNTICMPVTSLARCVHVTVFIPSLFSTIWHQVKDGWPET